MRLKFQLTSASTRAIVANAMCCMSARNLAAKTCLVWYLVNEPENLRRDGQNRTSQRQDLPMKIANRLRPRSDLRRCDVRQHGHEPPSSEITHQAITRHPLQVVS